MSSGKIHRITLFKIPNGEDQEKTLEAYRRLAADNKKDGSQYIISCTAHKLHEDPRSNGFTVCAQTTFSDLDDMKYYDEQCEAHQRLKGTVRPLAQGMMMVYMDA